MKISIHVECSSADEAQGVLAKLGNAPAGKTAAAPTRPSSTPPARPTPTTAPKPSAQPAASSTKQPAAPARPAAARPSPTPAASPSSAGGEIDYERDVKPLAYKLAQSNRPRLLEIYKQFGVTVGHELKPEQLPEALALLQAETSV